MKKFVLCLLALALMLAPVSALAYSIVGPNEDFYYLDEAGVLSQATEGEIFFANQLLQQACGAQIVIAALDDIGGADIFEYATDMGDAWGIGDADEDNGFLLLMTIDNEDYYATTGKGLSRIFSSSTLKTMFDDYLEADFAAGRYDQGARKFFEAVFERIASFYNLSITPQDGVAAYQAFLTSNTSAANFGGASGGRVEEGGGWRYTSGGYYVEEEDSMIELIVTIIVLVLLVMLMSRIRGGAFWFWRPTFYWPFFGPIHGPRPRHHHGPNPGPGPRRRPPRGGGGFGGFGGGSFGGGGSRGGFGGFGGGFGGGGGGFGGGAGRGRH